MKKKKKTIKKNKAKRNITKQNKKDKPPNKQTKTTSKYKKNNESPHSTKKEHLEKQIDSIDNFQPFVLTYISIILLDSASILSYFLMYFVEEHTALTFTLTFSVLLFVRWGGHLYITFP